MANADSSSKSGKLSSFTIFFASIFVLYIGVTAVQVYINAPEARAQVACYNTSVIHELFWVGPVKIFAPKDYALHTANSNDVQKTYESCVGSLERWGWLNKL